VLVVFDTNVLVAGLRSALGASNALLQRAANGDFHVAVSTALALEYADVLGRPGVLPTYSPDAVDAFIDSFCAIAREAYIYFRWRPFLSDPEDDLIFECALAAGASHIVTHNTRDFRGAEIFGLSVLTPAQFLSILPTP
jgi:predicted nucleic acid-binding protein